MHLCKRRLTLEKEVDDKEDANEIFDLKKTKLDNLFYLGYGEWATTTDFVDHLHSDWFKDFAEVGMGGGSRVLLYADGCV